MVVAAPDEKAHGELSNLLDGQLWVALLSGVAIGAAIAFVVAFVIASFAAPWPGSLLIALWGGLVAGPFVGIQVTLITRAAREEAVTKAAKPAPTPQAAPAPTKPRLA
ncbi:MAG: hypothetical protein ACRDJU_05295 [Actinomycetota bacterium]